MLFNLTAPGQRAAQYSWRAKSGTMRHMSLDADNSFTPRMPTGTDDPLSDAEIKQYRAEIDRLDKEIIAAVKRRQAVSQAIGRTRMGSGGTKLVHTREVQIINQFREEIGEEGPGLAAILLRMGRGKLG